MHLQTYMSAHIAQQVGDKLSPKVCVYASIYCTSASVHLLCVYVCERMHACTHVCVCVCMHPYVCVRLSIQVLNMVATLASKWPCVCVCVCVCLCVCDAGLCCVSVKIAQCVATCSLEEPV